MATQGVVPLSHGEALPFRVLAVWYLGSAIGRWLRPESRDDMCSLLRSWYRLCTLALVQRPVIE